MNHKLLDSQSIELHCPSCRRAFKQTIGKLRTNPQYTCVCGQVTRIKADELDRAVKSVEQQLAQLSRTLSSLGKR